VGGNSGDLIRVGDKLTIKLTGVPDAGTFDEVAIPATGDISMALLKDRTFHAVGRTTDDLAQEIMAAYKEKKIYTFPHITILFEERYVNVGGDVRTPQRVVYTSDLTLLGAINACGGFTEYAKRGAVRILRPGQQPFIVNATDAAKNQGADPHLQPGDQIYVPRSPF